jgi:DNA (cytosine-5)-methyltransferase 1
MSDLTLVELFAGIGGFSCAFESVGVKTVAAVEIDANARRVLAKNFPEATIFNDVTEVSGDALRAVGFVPQRGIITAGWPCQDISVAGRGNGLAGERSGLFSEILRLLEELSPRWFVLENVPRLLSINGGRDMGTVVGSLVERGYGIAYRVLDAQYFGVPQRRRRIFIVGNLGATGRTSAEILFEPESMHGNPTQGHKPWSASPAEAVSGSQRSGLADDFAVAALTANGVGTCGADDNQAQAGHLIAALRNFHGPLREEYGQHS